MKLILTAAILALSAFASLSQEDTSLALNYSKSIQAEELKAHLEVFASDSFGGREAGSVGQKMAMDYLLRNFKEMGIDPIGDSTYLQKFNLIEQENSGIVLSTPQKKFKNLEDFYIFNRYFKDTSIRTKAVFVGIGSEIDFSKADLEDKFAVFYKNDNMKDSTAPKTKEKLEMAKEGDAIGAMVITEDFKLELAIYDKYLRHDRMWLENVASNDTFPILYISNATAKAIFPQLVINESKAKEKHKSKTVPKEITISFDKPTKKLQSENVLAFIPGSDLKDEVLIITAHYDHIGRTDSLIYNGADDDGTGTVALLEIAEAFMLAKKEGNGPRRSVLVMPVSAEEKGLLGSSYYSDHPVFPLEKTVANLNVDMIGRIDEKHEGDPNYIYLIGSDRLSQNLHNISEAVAKEYFDIELDYTFNAEDDPNRFYYRSDHYNFAKHNIPVIFYFSGVHEDYHKPTDTVDKILFDKVEEVSRLIFMTAWEIANRNERPQLDKDI